MEFSHTSVLLEEVVSVFKNYAVKTILDCTLGGAGHAKALLQALPNLQLIGIDRDPDAVKAAVMRLSQFGERVRIFHADFSSMQDVIKEAGFVRVDGLLADFGVSSHQIDTAQRGFSFRFTGPLDMRMNPKEGQSAAELLKTIGEQDLANGIFQYGEERHSRKVARAILSAESLPKTTQELADIIRSVVKQGKDGIDPATRTFQALRIMVNKELDEIGLWLNACHQVLSDGGVVAAISFHSLEDRIVKKGFKEASLNCICPKELPVCCCNTVPTLEVLTRKPITASVSEIKRNPRARSARLRIARRLSRGESRGD